MILSRISISLAFTMSLMACGAECQSLAPVDIAGLGKDRPIQAVVTNVASSECRGSVYFKAGHPRYDGLTFDVHLSGNIII